MKTGTVSVRTLAQALAALQGIKQLPPGEAPNKDQWAAVMRAASMLEHELSMLPAVEVA